MSGKIIGLTALIGVATYLLRLLPMVATARAIAIKQRRHGRLDGFLSAIGPSFIAVFLAYSLFSNSGGQQGVCWSALKLIALLPVAATYWKTKNFGLAVLAGLLVYSALFFLMSKYGGSG